MKWPAMGYARVESLDELWQRAGRRRARGADPGGRAEPARDAVLPPVGALGPRRHHPHRRAEGRLASPAIHAAHRRADPPRRTRPRPAGRRPCTDPRQGRPAHRASRPSATAARSAAASRSPIPAAELPACVVALDATIVIASRGGERRVAAGDFFQGLFSTDLQPGEIIAAVEVPVATPASRQKIVEVTRRSGDYAMAGLAAVLAMQAGRPGRGGAPRLFRRRLRRRGREGRLRRPRRQAARRDASIAAAKAALADDLDPPGDLHGGPELKRHLARVLTGRALSSFLAPAEQAA
jgi:carbon-monoxide dehydrogenase medium subunit